MLQNTTGLGEICYEKIIPQRDAVFVPIPRWIAQNVQERLEQHHIHLLYRHQAQALEAVTNRDNVVISTGTASGKSLCYQLPLLDMLMNEPEATALLIFPTKALTQDQRKSLHQLIPEHAPDIAIYDGDTPRYQRTAIRNTVRVLFTNPDMLHMGILPYHAGWLRFFQHLKYIVLDEAHVYKGVFGSQTANVIRRLLRVTEHYQQTPQFILCSATLSNARQLAEKLTGSPFQAFSEDDSGSGERSIQYLNPPIVNEELSLRAGAIFTAAKTAKELLKNSRQLLLFCQSRQSVESAVRRLRDYGVDADGYRSGYLARERRQIEAGLKSGAERCVVATNALELGMDIGGMDSVISIGYPGSVSALTQRMGRAGRGGESSSFVMIASQNPVDQYLMSHPDFLTHRPCEPVLIDPDNLMIVLQHLQCALYELPFDRGDLYGNLTMEETQDLLDYLVSLGVARLSGTRYFWMESELPQAAVSLRNSGPERISIVCNDLGKAERVGEVDRSSAYWMVHKGAVYFHNGISYLIQDLDLKENIATAIHKQTCYTTEAQKKTEIDVNRVLERKELSEAEIMTADVTVHEQVVSYQKKDNDSYQLIETCPLDLPEETLETRAFIIVLNESLREKLRAAALWQNDRNDYGVSWPQVRKAAINRDQYTCQLCHQRGAECELQVHHIIPFRQFVRADEANRLENLVTLCPECHRRVEAAVQMRSGLTGFASAFHQISTLFLECDTADLSAIPEAESKSFDGRPAIFLHEQVAGGIGLSQAILERFELIRQAAQELITHCDCEDGCPGCIGPAGENGSGGKAEALAILQELSLSNSEAMHV